MSTPTHREISYEHLKSKSGETDGNFNYIRTRNRHSELPSLVNLGSSNLITNTKESFDLRRDTSNRSI